MRVQVSLKAIERVGGGHIAGLEGRGSLLKRNQCDHSVTTGPFSPKTTKPQATVSYGLTWGFSVYAPRDLNPEPAD